MKKTSIILSSMLLAFCMISCGEAIEIPDVEGKPVEEIPETPEIVSGDVVFTSTVEALPDGSAFTWAGGDKILLSDGKSVQTLTNSAEAGQIAKFPAKIGAGASEFVAVAPATDGISIDGTTVSFNIPATVSAGAPISKLMLAKATGKQLYFRHLVSEVRFSIDYEGVTAVRFQSGNGVKIAGDITVDYSGDTPVVSATSDVVEVRGNFTPGTTYSFMTIASDLEDCSVVLYMGETASSHVGFEKVTAKAGLAVTLPAIRRYIPTYRITNMWLWGGTGPEYDCSKVYDILTKPGCFNNEDGRGIEALKDNYYELHHDGRFVNNAGEDGRNWWFVFDGEQNLANKGKDVDVRSFYDLLPLGEGSYSVNGDQITFTKADGSTTTAQVVPAGTYEMPGTSPALSVNITHQALKFTIMGGKDNWDFTWQDYGVIVCRPRVLFIELEQLPDGFVVPEASRTRDEDFEYIPPVDPGDVFDWASFPGRWTVYGGNSAPYGISVLGGSGDDPAFVSPIDKSWDWDDSIWKESDNGLVINVTSQEGNIINGTTNWWAGNDGQFWNYTWKSTGEDLSRFYNKIPKGEHGFTLDMAALTVTFDNGNVAKLLIPGEHQFAYGKVWTVPDGCFALDFHLMDPVAATSQRWTDVDRFVNAPLEYVIQFEKE